MSFEFENLTTLARIIFANIDETCGFNAFNQVRIDLIAVAVAFVNGVSWPVEGADLAGINLPQRWAATQAHCAAKVGFGNFRHEHNSSVGWIVFELG